MGLFIVALMEKEEHVDQVRICLEADGHNVVFANSFANAKKLLQSSRCDLIITDVHLENGGDVFGFLKWAKSEGQLSKIPFVLFALQPSELAKYLSDGVRMAARQLGSAKYISMEKFDAAILIDALSEFFPKLKARQDSESKTPSGN